MTHTGSIDYEVGGIEIHPKYEYTYVPETYEQPKIDEWDYEIRHKGRIISIETLARYSKMFHGGDDLKEEEEIIRDEIEALIECEIDKL